MSNTLKVVLIEDELPVLRMLCLMLEHEGFEVRGTNDGEDGMALLQDGWADIVLTDLLMPGKDGIELLREIRRMPHHPRVVAMSGGGHQLTADFILEIAQHLGADAILHKPFTCRELTETLQQVALKGHVTPQPSAS